MAGNKKPRHKHKPRARGDRLLATQPLKVKLAFQPLDDIIAELERDETISIDADGRPVFLNSADGHYYTTVPAFSGFIEFYEIVEGRRGIDLDLDPLRAFRDKLERGEMLTEADTTPAKACIERLRAVTYRLTAGEADEIASIAELSGTAASLQFEAQYNAAKQDFKP